MLHQETPDRTSLPGSLNALIARLIARAAPLRFEIAHEAAELEAIYRLRYRVVIERGWADPGAFPEGLERDDFDDGAIQVAAWDGRVLAASTRLVLPETGRPMPTEAAFDLDIEPRGRVADIGRACVAPDYRDMRSRVFLALLGRAWIEAQARGFPEICGVFTDSVCRLYRAQGIPVLILGPPRLYWGETRFPVLVRPLEAIHALTQCHRDA